MKWPFLFTIVLYQFALAGLDRMVTGVIDPGIHGRIFLAYCLWHTLMNQAIACMGGLLTLTFTGDVLLSLAIYITITWCWVGGTLDFLYFMMRGEIPEWSHIWTWFPFDPKTWHVAVYAFCWLMGITIMWGLIN